MADMNYRRKISTFLVVPLLLLTFLNGMIPIRYTGVRAQTPGESMDNYEAYFRWKPAGDMNWSREKRLSDTPTNTTNTQIAYNPNYHPDYLVSVFRDNTTDDFDWYFSTSYNGGSSWSDMALAINVSYNVSKSRVGCSLEMDTNGTAHFVWQRHRVGPDGTVGIYYSNYNGTSWSTPLTIAESMGPTSLYLGVPTIAVGRNNILHMSFGTDRPGHDNGEIMYTRSTDGGANWSIPVDINQFTGMDVGLKAGLCADDSGNVYIAFGPDWYSSGYLGETYFRSSSNDGLSWTAQKCVTKGKYSEGHVSLNCDNNGGVFLVFKGTRDSAAADSGMKEILYKYSLDYGNTWTPDSGGIYVDTTYERYNYVYSALNGSEYIHIVYDNVTEYQVHEGYYVMINLTGETVIPRTMITPDDSQHSIVTKVMAFGDRVYVSFDNWIENPKIPDLYIRSEGPDIVLNWTRIKGADISHYLIFRSTSQTGFNFSNVWVNTSIHDDNGIIPKRSTLNDTNASLGSAPREYYYTLRAVLKNGEITRTSRTVGKYTKIFQSGISTFSLPLLPQSPLWIQDLIKDMSAEYIDYMDASSLSWLRHHKNNGTANITRIELGKGYCVKFNNSSDYTFCGLPAAMIMFNDLGFAGFDPRSDAKSLQVTAIQNKDVNLTWQEPSIMGPGCFYEIFYSYERDGFFGTRDSDYHLLGRLMWGENSMIHENAQTGNPKAGLYYMIVPYNSLGIRGSSAYSKGLWTQEYLQGYDTMGIPLKMNINLSADWYCDNIPFTIGINHFIENEGRWTWHSKGMGAGAFDRPLVQGEGYQISTSNQTRFIFIGV